MTGMERLLRLRRGVQRDYSQTVEFPVEIVGRDGRVRRFSYDESVRLYQRRIRSAMLRFDDASEVDEEVLHCQQRIEQLRRSYLEYFAASTLQSGLSGSDSSVIGSSLGAEVASFLRRAFPEEVDGPPLMQCSVVERGVGDTIFVKIGDRSYLLYAWRIDGQGPAGAVEAWKKTRERLAGMPVMEGVERLLTAWQSGDCALLLTGAGELPDLSALDEIALPGSGDLFIDGMRALYDGHLGTAIGLFESGLEQQPGRRVLASSAALVALMDGQAERAAFNACVGRLHHAHDPLLRYIQALALCHQRRFDEGWKLLCEDIKDRPLGTGPEMLLYAMFQIRNGHIGAAATMLRHLRQAPSELRFVPRTAGRMLIAMVQCSTLLMIGLLAIGLGTVMLYQSSLAAAALLLIGLLSVVALPCLARWGVDWVLSTRHRTLHMLSTELFPRERKNDVPN